MEVFLAKAFESLFSGSYTAIEIFCITALAFIYLAYKFYVKPMINETSEVRVIIEEQQKTAENIKEILERLEKQVVNIVDNDEFCTKSSVRAQEDIEEIKKMLSQFQGAMMYNKQIFNRELE